MIETYKIMQEMDKVDKGKLFFPVTQYQNQGTSTQIECWESENKRKSFFTQHVVSLWNSLPQDVVMASGLDAFKRGLDRLLEEKSIAGYKP